MDHDRVTMRKALRAAFALVCLCIAGIAQAQGSGIAQTSKPQSAQFSNPVIPGFAPDPSIVRVDRDYYLVTSSFEYFPALPIYHSRDLVNWELIGHALSDPKVAGLSGVASSGGVQAATIRFHNGLFYVVTTRIVDDKPVSFIVTAANPKGPWSAPHVIADAVGIDPSLLFDDDGRVWYTANWLPQDPQFPGQAEIWLQELDLASFALVGPRHPIWRGCCQGVWTEAPHIYKKGGNYYLLVAEGGTSYEHAVSVAVAKSITGPYRNNPRNPVLTHRHLSYDHPITGVGHADLVELPDGRWYAVALGWRLIDGRHGTLGRETFLLPVTWESEREWWKDDKQTFPVFSPASGKVELKYPVPLPGTRQVRTNRFHDDFARPELNTEWTFRRSPEQAFHSLSAKPGSLRLRLQAAALAEKAQYSFVGIRQRQFQFAASTQLEFVPQAQEEAGLVLIQKDQAAYSLTLARRADGLTALRLSRFDAAGRTQLAEQLFAASKVLLRVTGNYLSYQFEFSSDARQWIRLGPSIDGRSLSPAVLSGFNYTGVFIGLYASSNGLPTRNFADFDWFDYRTPAAGADDWYQRANDFALQGVVLDFRNWLTTASKRPP